MERVGGEGRIRGRMRGKYGGRDEREIWKVLHRTAPHYTTPHTTAHHITVTHRHALRHCSGAACLETALLHHDASR
jgi:hypothetical protein